MHEIDAAGIDDLEQGAPCQTVHAKRARETAVLARDRSRFVDFEQAGRLGFGQPG